VSSVGAGVPGRVLGAWCLRPDPGAGAGAGAGCWTPGPGAGCWAVSALLAGW